MPRSTRSFDMRMSDSRRPNGIASGKAQATMPIAIKKPQNTTGRLDTNTDGFKNSFRNRTLFHDFTQSCWASESERDSKNECDFTVIAGSVSMATSVPSASVYAPVSCMSPPISENFTL